MNAVLKHYQDLHLPLPCVWNVQLGDHSLSEVSEEVHKIALTSNGHCVGDRNSCAVCVCSLLQLCVLHLCVCTYVCTFGMYVRMYVRTYIYVVSHFIIDQVYLGLFQINWLFRAVQVDINAICFKTVLSYSQSCYQDTGEVKVCLYALTYVLVGT